MSLILYFVKIPKEKRPSSGPYVYPAALKIELITLSSFISLKININIERSTEEIFNIFNENCSNKIVLDDLKSMLKKIDAVRFSNIQSADYKRDINSFQKLLKKLDSEW